MADGTQIFSLIIGEIIIYFLRHLEKKILIVKWNWHFIDYRWTNYLTIIDV